jgi:DNA replication protein DnaC
VENCKKCGGRGYLLAENGMVIVCDCQKKEVVEKLYGFVGVTGEFKNVVVDQENTNIKTIKNRELTFDQLTKYILWNWKNKNNISIYIQGPTGTGKSLFTQKLLEKVVEVAEREGMKIKNTAYWIEFEELLDRYKNGWKSFEIKMGLDNALDRDILIIDDFLKRKKGNNGKRKANELLSYDIAYLNNLLSRRTKKPVTILTSNEPIEEVMMNVDDDQGRISSRLGNYEVFRFFEGKKYKDYRNKENEITADNFNFDNIKGDF